MTHIDASLTVPSGKVRPEGLVSGGLEGVLASRAALYLRVAHNLDSTAAREAGSLAARRAIAVTPHWRLESAGRAAIREAQTLVGRADSDFATLRGAFLPPDAPRAMPEQNLDRLGFGDLGAGTRRVQRRLLVRLRNAGPELAALVVMAVTFLARPGLSF
ncbi:hypothetical protein [Rhodospirillum rubrum]|uniref:Uncharacterized protein n=1 Tax=Rhodospirillum rubrum (strain ATCC 11170 / ATH 1.1.1 / DSM 467 / LMG 4362 / NCIMB 8255 / S1) TaxID=269796 RepID=Q2RSG1_RHORT|nr:hypothetical protein [Rhodospirillum rubrum]ABC22934.1 hypothetical protein Rru_A2134 [Rhodospirillum rubrum ATCC 11170]AEO48662.1 hypothetical protein F11_10990 [Rhodospirillum rubrum F11]MBK5954555.1 hypothetical protein [Rhodospirillum rubrum]QXG78921.1 hypothetical protein KUL73_11040 [Rhodospirillum rubrum]HAP99465.1 hypothetical protein [Rhodospirillum rubrum]